MGICNKIAGALASVAFGAILLKNMDKLEAKLITLNPIEKAAELDALSARVITPYIIMAVILSGLSVLIYYASLPEIETDGENEEVAAANKNKTSVMQFPNLLLGSSPPISNNRLFRILKVENLVSSNFLNFMEYLIR